MRFLNCGVFVIAVVLCFSKSSFGQDDVNKFLQENVKDATKLIGAYVEPCMKSVSLGLNQGWYNTAKPHKIAGVDLTISFNAMTIPKSEALFDVSKLGLQQIELDPSSEGYPFAPTLVGPDISPRLRLKSDPTNTFDGPPGIDLEGNLGGSWIPVPIAHLGFGLPKSTDLKIRFSPTINIGDNSTVKIFGLGVMHDVKQWIPGVKMLPFDLSGFVGFTNLKFESVFGKDPQGGDQTGVFEINATTIQGLISKKFSVVTFYGGIGYNIAKSSLAMKGWYDIDEDNVKDPAQFEVNPVDLQFAASGPRTTLGMRLKLAVFTFHADYTLQKYKCFSAGFGINVR